MSQRLIYEVRQREQDGTREVAFFTDAAMALQMIDTLYRRLWNLVNTVPLPIGLISEELAASVLQSGIDLFMDLDKNGPAPIFYSVSHTIYNAIPVVGENLEVIPLNVPFTLFDQDPNT